MERGSYARFACRSVSRAFYREGARGRVHLVTVQEAEERFERALFHEAGHVAVALSVGIRIRRVKVNAERAVTTRVPGAHPVDESDIPRQVAFLGAGYLAERRRFIHEAAWTRRCAETDLRDLRRVLGRRNRALGRVGLRLAWRTLAARWSLVLAIAESRSCWRRSPRARTGAPSGRPWRRCCRS